MATAHGQLLSPGKLAAPHAQLEGVRHCTECHQLGQRGIANGKCLECHEPLGNRIARREGFHATLTDRNCAECHKDHFGREFVLVRLDTAAFDHRRETGFPLTGGHADVRCRDCHRPELIVAADVRAFKGRAGALGRTLLGLETTCESCHVKDSPHDDQFAKQACRDCHTDETWERAERFDHDKARFRLTGLHRQVACADCHRPSPGRTAPHLQYEGIPFASCTSCHRDVHAGAMGTNCTSCHSTAGWRRIDRVSFEGRFDHSGTGFPLVGRHAELDCAACHQPGSIRDRGIRLTPQRGKENRTYPPPIAKDCVSCHLDYHEGVFQKTAGGIVCQNCHGETAWLPTGYDIGRHNREAAFALTGAHLAVPCGACHGTAEAGAGTLKFRFVDQECESCHSRDNPHGTQFAGQACASCHDTRAFTIKAFDHIATRFPLDGAHRTVPCVSCHIEATTDTGATIRVYKPLGVECRDCHGGGP